MAQMTFFHYIHKNTVLHKMDGRLKILCMLLLSLSVGFASLPQHFAVLSGIIALALIVSKLPVAALLRDIKFFAIIILFVLIVDVFSAGRLILIIMLCTVMTGTTSLLTFKNAIEWYLRPVPFIPEVRVATMINLTFVLIPVIFDSYTEMMNAQKARCIDARKNPIKKINFIVFPLLTGTLRRADEIVLAMESRRYSETRTRAVFTTHKIDFLILAICIAAFIFIIM